MASRLRGRVILASTIISRTQQLLETGVIKKKPIWLEVVEAYPPLRPPPVPAHVKKGKCPQIIYPDDENDSIVFAPKVKGLPPNVTSLFESYTFTEVERWKPNRFGDVMEDQSVDDTAAKENISDLERNERKEDKELINYVDNDIMNPHQSGANLEQMSESSDTAPYKMDKSIVELANLLKDLEKDK